MPGFVALSLDAALARAVEVLEFAEMTPVQEHALPPLLEGKDVIAQARSGSGKTLAFGLALLSRLDVDADRVQALVLCPTRELADQVSSEIRRLARFIPNLRVVTLCGGVPLRTQKPALQRTPQVLVGTPGRIQDHLRRQTVTLDTLRVLVLDEADRMLDMGFADAIADVVAHTSGTRQTMLFSATFPAEIRTLSRKFQNKPVEITVDTEASEVEIEQVFYEVEPQPRMEALTALLHAHAPETALVFCHTRKDTREVAARLGQDGFSVLALHGELEQRERDEVLLRFSHRSCSVLVATDIAARGLDIKGLSAVISWELPIDPDVHVHRIGRTGRAGQKGLALALCSPRERDRVTAIERKMGVPVRWGKLSSPAASRRPLPPPMVTFLIDRGKQDKLRAGDLLGALTGDVGLPGDAVGKIDILATRTYVAIKREHADVALEKLRGGKIKGKSFRLWRCEGGGRYGRDPKLAKARRPGASSGQVTRAWRGGANGCKDLPSADHEPLHGRACVSTDASHLASGHLAGAPQMQRRSSRLSTAILGLALVTCACDGDGDAISPSPATPTPTRRPRLPAPPTPPPAPLPPRPPPPAPVPPSPPSTVPPPVPKDAIIVVGDADNPSAGEEDLNDTLERSLLFNLVTFADDSELPRDFDPGLVIISSSVDENDLNDEWGNERLPVVVMSHAMYPFMLGVGEHGVLPLVEPEILEPDHPIVAEFAGDRLGPLEDAQFGVPPSSATIIVGELGNRSARPHFRRRPGRHRDLCRRRGAPGRAPPTCRVLRLDR